MISRGGKKEKEKRWISSTLLLLFFLLVFLCNVANARRKIDKFVSSKLKNTTSVKIGKKK